MYECGKLLAIWASKRKKKSYQHRESSIQPTICSESISTGQQSFQDHKVQEMGCQSSLLFGMGWGQAIIQSTALQYIQAHILSKGGNVFKTLTVKTHHLLVKHKGLILFTNDKTHMTNINFY